MKYILKLIGDLSYISALFTYLLSAEQYILIQNNDKFSHTQVENFNKYGMTMFWSIVSFDSCYLLICLINLCDVVSSLISYIRLWKLSLTD